MWISNLVEIFRLCVATVWTDRHIASAISLLLNPLAIYVSTSISRSLSTSNFSFSKESLWASSRQIELILLLIPFVYNYYRVYFMECLIVTFTCSALFEGLYSKWLHEPIHTTHPHSKIHTVIIVILFFFCFILSMIKE